MKRWQGKNMFTMCSVEGRGLIVAIDSYLSTFFCQFQFSWSHCLLITIEKISARELGLSEVFNLRIMTRPLLKWTTVHTKITFFGKRLNGGGGVISDSEHFNADLRKILNVKF